MKRRIEGLPATPRGSAFEPLGFQKTVAQLIEVICELYLEDGAPWVVGYSGGKDSTAVLQLVWTALRQLAPEQRRKTVHVISTDTLVENPVVAAWVNQSLTLMRAAAQEQGVPIEPHRLTPAIRDTFWVNLIGKGYPAPRTKFRWCTSRLKISPSNKFIRETVERSGEAILVLGTRKQESTVRARSMAMHEANRHRDLLSPNGNLPNCLVFSPIEDWSTDDVWTLLMRAQNPWGWSNKELLGMYQGATADGECPLVVDGTTPSCGDSRFGCWVCTMVEKDKSMAAMIQNDEEKEWMLPLLQLRNELDKPGGSDSDKHLRDFRRMSGAVHLFHDAPLRGPYIQSAREDWLRKLLEAQTWVRRNGPGHVRNIELVTVPELEEIRRLWITEKHEIEDNLPRIYREVTGDAYPGAHFDDNVTFGSDEIELLRKACDGDELHFQTVRELLDVSRRHRTMARRRGLYDELQKAIERGFYDDEVDAAQFIRDQLEAKDQARKRERALNELPLFREPQST
jgi:DNA sulfur modification protein DndC